MAPAILLLTLFAANVCATTAQGAASPANSRARQFESWFRADSDGDGRLSREEAQRVPRLVRRFDRIDRNADGFITGPEVRAWRASTRVVSSIGTGKGANEILRIADLDGNGVLSRAEFAQRLPRFAGRFDRIDADADGLLARAELEQWLASLRAARRSKPARQ